MCDASMYYLDVLNELQKRVIRAVDVTLDSSPKCSQSKSALLVDICSSEVVELVLVA